MTNSDDPRTPQERAYDDSATSGPDGTEAWSRDEQRTEYLGPAEQRTQQFYTSDPTAAYGQNQPNPTQALPPYDPRFDSGAPPPNATQAYPPYDSQQYYGGYPTGQYPNPQYPPRAPVEEPDDKKPRRIATWIAAAAAALLLIGVIGFGVALFTTAPNNSSSTTAAGPTTSRPPATTAPPRTSAPPSTTSESPLDRLPGGIGEAIGEAGAAFGTISANDGMTLTLDAVGGSQVTVRTNAQTNVIALDGATVADLKPGFTVMVQGTKIENGAMTAETIISTELPRLGGN
ncbi:hypothetical protein [Rhodococcus tibetensis]|uniref:DUF5666 domain-containing protein n=1 Tax=Rhodococcus tibetensis TaxID=2965064 RepID=A0ABT1Q784_9NOCA|nr:hypothetical protein [Rhodococcus sp. FXJ9.536]MCQ4118114.1 hypothetical protein [Rhodococcus sp. FXJ9.536]